MKREFLQQAQTYKNQNIAGWFMSEKLDGWRAFWDGGVSRGKWKDDCPWANLDKDSRYVERQVATGLWTRYGNVIHAPNEWLDLLPVDQPLDGELYNPELARQELLSITKKLNPDTHAWMDNVGYWCYDSPSLRTVFAEGEISFSSTQKRFLKTCPESFIGHGGARFASWDQVMPKRLSGIIRWHTQAQLSWDPAKAQQELFEFLKTLKVNDGEGAMLRDGDSYWRPERGSWNLKAKIIEDMEVTVVGYRTGKITDRGSSNRGRIGSLIVKDSSGRVFDVCGLNAEERVLTDHSWAYENPDTVCPDHVKSVAFPRGRVITIQYRGRTVDGVPMEGRYWRNHEST